MLVQLDGGAVERTPEPGVVPLRGSGDEIAAGLDAMATAGADEVILVCDPITEASIMELGDVLAILRG